MPQKCQFPSHAQLSNPFCHNTVAERGSDSQIYNTEQTRWVCLKEANAPTEKQFFPQGLRPWHCPELCVPHRWALQGELWGRQPSQGAVGKVLGGCEVPPTLSHSMVCDSMLLRTASWKCKRTSKFFMVPHQLHPRVTQCTLSSEISLLMAASPKAWKANAGRKNPGQHAFLGQEFSDCVKICLT